MNEEATGVVDLDGRFVLLSASFPSEPRAARFPPAHPRDIADATVAVIRGVLAANGRLVLGGHPTITPLVLMVAREYEPSHQGQDRVVIYQSRLFRDAVSPATRQLEEAGFGHIRWVPGVRGENLAGDLSNLRSLDRMRRLMIREARPVAAFFIGGMEGIILEQRLLADQCDRAFAFAMSAPGGAAATLAEDFTGQPAVVLGSRLYPAMVFRALADVQHALLEP